jgi:hypothetical protein
MPHVGVHGASERDARHDSKKNFKQRAEVARRLARRDAASSTARLATSRASQKHAFQAEIRMVLTTLMSPRAARGALSRDDSRGTTPRAKLPKRAIFGGKRMNLGCIVG